MALRTRDIELTNKVQHSYPKKESDKVIAPDKKNKMDLNQFTKLSTTEKYRVISKKFKELFELEKEENPKFICVVCYKHENEYVISRYPSQIQGGKDIYIEFRSKDYIESEAVPGICEKDTLWKWVHNPEYDTEYKKSEPNKITGDRFYYIPVDELINITELHAKKEDTVEQVEVTVEKGQLEIKLDIAEPGTDAPYSSLTIRDHAAILWKKPVSYKKWLNELIINTHK